MSVYWSSGIAELEAYVPGEQPQDAAYVKLNTNENPYPPSPRVAAAIREAADERLRLYPDPLCAQLRDVIAEHHGLGRSEVFIGNGSDEILAFAFAAFLDHGETILYPDISYSFYPVYTRFFRLSAERVPVDEAFRMVAEDYLKPNGGIVFPNPNAPTSLSIPLSEVRRLLDYNRALGRVVIVDEAYVDFGAESAAPLIRDYPNLLVVQTFSKSRCLAGLRVGFALGQSELIQGLERVKDSINSYTLDRLALVGAVEAMRDEEHFRATRARIIATRTRVSLELRELGFSVPDSSANFIFISHPEFRADYLYRALKEHHVLVRYFNKPRIDNHLRVSIGTDEEMLVFLDALRKIQAKGRP
jgi:histidinol-phosphate aminotransferase